MATIKKELIYRRTFKSRNAARLAIFDRMERLHNPPRQHSPLGNMSPADYELAAATATSFEASTASREQSSEPGNSKHATSLGP